MSRFPASHPASNRLFEGESAISRIAPNPCSTSRFASSKFFSAHRSVISARTYGIDRNARGSPK